MKYFRTNPRQHRRPRTAKMITRWKKHVKIIADKINEGYGVGDEK